MFLCLGNDYINLDTIARCEFQTIGTNLTATIYFSKTGGADRHIVSGDNARKLEQALKRIELNLEEPAPKRKKK